MRPGKGIHIREGRARAVCSFQGSGGDPPPDDGQIALLSDAHADQKLGRGKTIGGKPL